MSLQFNKNQPVRSRAGRSIMQAYDVQCSRLSSFSAITDFKKVKTWYEKRWSFFVGWLVRWFRCCCVVSFRCCWSSEACVLCEPCLVHTCDVRPRIALCANVWVRASAMSSVFVPRVNWLQKCWTICICLPRDQHVVWEIAIVKSLTIFNNRIDESGNISFKVWALGLLLLWSCEQLRLFQKYKRVPINTVVFISIPIS